ncbi:MAG TPA: methyltransferase domain-containing protein [Candidatus Dormibacteraeota bacterium]|nr:methyltransferase domain-containing protein [Candidatus Dormibacteraeota bacterium]
MEQPAAKDLYPGTFSRVAAAYKRRLDEVMARGEAHGRTAAVDWLHPTPGQRILDLACGPGTLSYPLAIAVSPGGTVVGIDLAPGMIELAQRETPPGLPVRFELMDMEDLRFPDHSFDSAVCGHGLQFVPDLRRALSETRRVLKPGSRLAASVPVDPSQPSAAQAILERAVGGALPPAPKARDQFATRRIVEDEESFAGAAKQAGFSAVDVARYEESTTWSSPQHFIEMSAGWWSMALRLDQVSPSERTALLERARRAIEAELGPGPLQIAGATNVLRAIA